MSAAGGRAGLRHGTLPPAVQDRVAAHVRNCGLPGAAEALDDRTLTTRRQRTFAPSQPRHVNILDSPSTVFRRGLWRWCAAARPCRDSLAGRRRSSGCGQQAAPRAAADAQAQRGRAAERAGRGLVTTASTPAQPRAVARPRAVLGQQLSRAVAASRPSSSAIRRTPPAISIGVTRLFSWRRRGCGALERLDNWRAMTRGSGEPHRLALAYAHESNRARRRALKGCARGGISEAWRRAPR